MSRLRLASMLLLPGLFVAFGACTLTSSLDGYTGGTKDAGVTPQPDTARDEGVDARDTAIADTFDASTPDDAIDSTAPDTFDASMLDTSVDSFTPDTFKPDTFVLDTGSDTGVVVDTSGADTFIADGGCGTPGILFGLSEVMVRAVSGAADKREWIELTNYDKCTLDVSGITVKVVGGALERASFTFPAGTTVAAGEAVVIADDDVSFKADVAGTFMLGKVFSFGKPGGDVLVNSSSFNIRLFPAGSTVPYEDAVIPSRTWPIGRSFAYPPPSATCPASGRLSGTALSAAWKDTAMDIATKYGEFMGTPFHGTPTKANTGIACP